MVNLSTFSLYKTVGIVIVATVIAVMSIYSGYNYHVLKENMIKQMKEDSLFTIQSHEKNLEFLISSYSVHEYDTLIRNHMEQRNILAIVIEDYKTGEILGKSPFVSGVIRDPNNHIVDFDPDDKSQTGRLTKAFYFQKHPLRSESGEELGTISIYVSGDSLHEELNRIIVTTIINVIVLSLLLGAALFAMLRLVVLQPLYELNQAMTKGDDDGIPQGNIPKTGTMEMVALASTMERMITAIKESQNNLKEEHDRLVESESQLLMMLELSPIAVRIATLDGKKVIFANLAYGELIHTKHDKIVGQNPQDYYREPGVYDAILKRLYENETITNETVELSVEGKTIWALASYTLINFQGKTSVLGWFYDITDQKETERRLEHYAHHDVLTGLPNRAFLSSFMPRILARSKRNGTYAALMFIDLDGFKQINDDYGHDAGDFLLKEVAHRLSSLLRGDDLISRLGGDEFTVMIGDLGSKEEVVPLLHRILETLKEPFGYDQYQLFVSASIGVTFFPQGREVDADTLLRQADQAMYEAKVRGKNQFAYYDEIEHNSSTMMDDASKIGSALKNGQFILHYQPKVVMPTGEVLGAEALIRWNDPGRGIVYPDQFLNIIENRPLMYSVDQWVLNTAVRQLSEWNKKGLKTSVSINLSAYSFKQSSLMEMIDKVFETYPDVLPTQLEIEILETSALHDIQDVQNVIAQLHERGISVALDDFGTGYSTLSYLKKLKIDYLKLDKSFVIDMLNDTSNLSILDATLGLAHAFNFKVIAEGVESIEHGNLLIQFGCDLAQGYVISHPMSPERFIEWVLEWKSDPSWRNVQKLPLHLLPLIYASVEHRGWFHDLENFWNDKDSTPPQSTASQCRFGEWLHDHGREFFEDEHDYAQIQKLHCHFHDLASQLVDEKDDESRTALWNMIQSLHHDLLTLLGQKLHLNGSANMG